MDVEKVKVSCANCGTTNNYPRAAQNKKVVCGRCKSPLPAPGTVLEPGPGQASHLFRSSRLPVLVDFYSPTCGPCHLMHPIVDRLAARRAGDLVVARVNVDAHPELARAFGVQAVPTFVIVHKSVERARTAGAAREEDFALWVAKFA